MKHTILLILIFSLSGCGNEGRRVKAPVMKASSPDPAVRGESQSSETYLASFLPLNEKFAGKVSGSLTIHKEGDFLAAHVRLLGAAPNIIHAQNVHFGGLCPNEAADTNLDGVVDIEEAGPYTDSIYVPLDGDINSQYSLFGMYPMADAWGAYVYSQTASFTRFMEDLAAPDEVEGDLIVKPANATFDLEGRVVMIQGVADESALPETVAATAGLTGNQSMPIACGVLNRVWSVPGSIEGDDISVGTTRVPARSGQPSTTRPPTAENPGTHRRAENERTSPLGTRKPCVREAHGKDCIRTKESFLPR